MEGTLSAKQVAEVLHVRPDLVLKMCDEGELPAIRIGKNWKIYPPALHEYLMERSYREARERKAINEKAQAVQVE